MPARRLYYCLRGEPLLFVINVYKKVIIPSIDERYQEGLSKLLEPLAFDYFATNTKEKSAFYDWSEAKNNLCFSTGYMGIFKDQVVHDEVKGLWIAYEALSLISELYPDLICGTTQIFHYEKRNFWVTFEKEKNCVIFSIPEEYLTNEYRNAIC